MPSLAAPAVAPGSLATRPQPTLVVDELTLRPWLASDAPAVAAAYADEAIQRWHVRSLTDDEAAGWVSDWARGWAAETAAGWAVADGDTLVGRTTFRPLDLHDGTGVAGYWVVPAARGRGVAVRALSAVTTWMFGELGFHRMTLLHSTGNPASCRVAERAGYPLEGIQRGQALHADGWHDMHLHARLRADLSP
ncbi:GNAT family N-acetyltransferase [uncultured Jatrophihabitans sp.]|uniref:GNAT family N-acetyltransferase n=1 Tax=uncultured Jatrophihabitans sp. TaxID=1610747 RepID=UPI0035C9B15C